MRKRIHLVIRDDFEIDIYPEEGKIHIEDPSKINGAGSIVEIPEDAVYFSGKIEDFLDFLKRMKKKYGHLYRKG